MSKKFINWLVVLVVFVSCLSPISPALGSPVFSQPGSSVNEKQYMPPDPSVYPELFSKEGGSVTRMGSPGIMGAPKESSSPARIPGAGSTEKVLVIPIQFSDTHFTPEHDTAYFQNMMTGPVYSLKDYYEKNSQYQNGVRGITIEATVAPIVTSLNPLSFYGADATPGNDDANGPVHRVAREAVLLLEAQGFDFSGFDSGDADNKIDHLFIIHAGNGQENSGVSNDIWSHRWVIGAGGQEVDGVIAAAYLTVPESGTIGVYNDTRKQDRQNGQNKLVWNYGKEKKFYTGRKSKNSD